MEYKRRRFQLENLAAIVLEKTKYRLKTILTCEDQKELDNELITKEEVEMKYMVLEGEGEEYSRQGFVRQESEKDCGI